MNIVAIRDMSAGNAEVGDMWQETAIFPGDTPVSEIVRWAVTLSDHESIPERTKLTRRLTITVPTGEVIDNADFHMPNASIDRPAASAGTVGGVVGTLNVGTQKVE